MEVSKKTIKRPDSPEDGPMDGAKMITDCIRTDFIENPKEGEALFNQQEKTEAHISASVEIGILSIRDMATGVMLTVSLPDAVKVINATVEAHEHK